MLKFRIKDSELHHLVPEPHFVLDWIVIAEAILGCSVGKGKTA